MSEPILKLGIPAGSLPGLRKGTSGRSMIRARGAANRKPRASAAATASMRRPW